MRTVRKWLRYRTCCLFRGKWMICNPWSQKTEVPFPIVHNWCDSGYSLGLQMGRLVWCDIAYGWNLDGTRTNFEYDGVPHHKYKPTLITTSILNDVDAVNMDRSKTTAWNGQEHSLRSINHRLGGLRGLRREPWWNGRQVTGLALSPSGNGRYSKNKYKKWQLRRDELLNNNWTVLQPFSCYQVLFARIISQWQKRLESSLILLGSPSQPSAIPLISVGKGIR